MSKNYVTMKLGKKTVECHPSQVENMKRAGWEEADNPKASSRKSTNPKTEIGGE